MLREIIAGLDPERRRLLQAARESGVSYAVAVPPDLVVGVNLDSNFCEILEEQNGWYLGRVDT